MINKNGFSLIEFLVYLGLFSCISLCLMHFSATSLLNVRTISSELQRTLHFLTALDLVANELEQAYAEKSLWYITEKNTLVWHSLSRKKDIGLCVKDKKLVRLLGTYLPGEKKWASKRTQVITDSIETIHFEYQWDTKQLVLITCSLRGFLNAKKTYNAHKSIAIYNRELV